MELSFELLREAGLRMPGPAGNTIGIVGGLIVGQAAVSANLVSPITVTVAALTALGSFSIPNEELSEVFRLWKYGILLLGKLLWDSGRDAWLFSSADADGRAGKLRNSLALSLCGRQSQ